MGRFSDLDILLTEPAVWCARGTPTTCAAVRTDWPHPLLVARLFPEWFHRPFEVFCLPSGVKFSETTTR